jgi:hypothetical protein
MSRTLELCNKCWESMHCVSQGDTCIIPLRNFWSIVRFKITWFPVLKTFIDAYGKPFFLQDNLCVYYISRITEQEQKKVSTHQVSVQLHQECVNVQQKMLVQGALVLFLFDTIAILPHLLICAFAFWSNTCGWLCTTALPRVYQGHLNKV